MRLLLRHQLERLLEGNNVQSVVEVSVQEGVAGQGQPGVGLGDLPDLLIPTRHVCLHGAEVRTHTADRNGAQLEGCADRALVPQPPREPRPYRV